jgi:hypothetical protein
LTPLHWSELHRLRGGGPTALHQGARTEFHEPNTEPFEQPSIISVNYIAELLKKSKANQTAARRFLLAFQDQIPSRTITADGGQLFARKSPRRNPLAVVPLSAA